MTEKLLIIWHGKNKAKAKSDNNDDNTIKWDSMINEDVRKDGKINERNIWLLFDGKIILL